jgi:hypothetical protein
MLYREDGLQLTICQGYPWEMAFNVGLDESPDNRTGRYMGESRQSK